MNTAVIDETKVRNGQFYTKGNPFLLVPFQRFHALLPSQDVSVVEPFAGANNIIKLMISAGYDRHDWICYDLHPEAQGTNETPQFPVQQRDTIADYPDGFSVAITNPPYLAKNSAKRKGMIVDFGAFDDLYQVSLQAMLEKTDYVAAIIPESFLTSKFPKTRCHSVVSLNSKMFDDTEHPVCLALFIPQTTEETLVYHDDVFIGELSELEAKMGAFFTSPSFRSKFNVPTGDIGFRGIDGTRGRSIEFFGGEQIDSSKIKVSSRALTRLDLPVPYERDVLLLEANRLIEEYRDLTQDVFLTSFKGIRKDGLYRRRMDFATAGRILAQAHQNVSASS